METIKKILIADDEPLNSYLFKEILRGLGYEILTASNGEEALHCIQKHIPDLVLMDIMMPTMTGL
ncbi:MAG: response regulator, partial [Bacteroidales bacterium]|nr:response regulator [Bacteroidales bacterium]